MPLVTSSTPQRSRAGGIRTPRSAEPQQFQSLVYHSYSFSSLLSRISRRRRLLLLLAAVLLCVANCVPSIRYQVRHYRTKDVFKLLLPSSSEREDSRLSFHLHQLEVEEFGKNGSFSDVPCRLDVLCPNFSPCTVPGSSLYGFTPVLYCSSRLLFRTVPQVMPLILYDPCLFSHASSSVSCRLKRRVRHRLVSKDQFVVFDKDEPLQLRGDLLYGVRRKESQEGAGADHLSDGSNSSHYGTTKDYRRNLLEEMLSSADENGSGVNFPAFEAFTSRLQVSQFSNSNSSSQWSPASSSSNILLPLSSSRSKRSADFVGHDPGHFSFSFPLPAQVLLLRDVFVDGEGRVFNKKKEGMEFSHACGMSSESASWQRESSLFSPSIPHIPKMLNLVLSHSPNIPSSPSPLPPFLPEVSPLPAPPLSPTLLLLSLLAASHSVRTTVQEERYAMAYHISGEGEKGKVEREEFEFWLSRMWRDSSNFSAYLSSSPSNLSSSPGTPLLPLHGERDVVFVSELLHPVLDSCVSPNPFLWKTLRSHFLSQPDLLSVLLESMRTKQRERDEEEKLRRLAEASNSSSTLPLSPSPSPPPPPPSSIDLSYRDLLSLSPSTFLSSPFASSSFPLSPSLVLLFDSGGTDMRLRNSSVLLHRLLKRNKTQELEEGKEDPFTVVRIRGRYTRLAPFACSELFRRAVLLITPSSSLLAPCLLFMPVGSLVVELSLSTSPDASPTPSFPTSSMASPLQATSMLAELVHAKVQCSSREKKGNTVMIQCNPKVVVAKCSSALKGLHTDIWMDHFVQEEETAQMEQFAGSKDSPVVAVVPQLDSFAQRLLDRRKIMRRNAIIPGTDLHSPQLVRKFRTWLQCVSTEGRWVRSDVPKRIPWNVATRSPCEWRDLNWREEDEGRERERLRRMDPVESDTLARRVKRAAREEGRGRSEEGEQTGWRVAEFLKYDWVPRRGCGRWRPFSPPDFCEKLVRRAGVRHILFLGDSITEIHFNSFVNLMALHVRKVRTVGLEGKDEDQVSIEPFDAVRVKWNSCFRNLDKPIHGSCFTVAFTEKVCQTEEEVEREEEEAEGEEEREIQREEDWAGSLGERGWEGGGERRGKARRRKQYPLLNFTVSYIRSHRLLMHYRANPGNMKFHLFKVFQSADVIVANVGAHHTTDKNYPERVGLVDFVRIHFPEKLFVFRNTVPGHPNCDRFERPLRKPQPVWLLEKRSFYRKWWWTFRFQNKIAEVIINKSSAVYMDVEKMTSLRADGHVSWKHQRGINRNKVIDCLHYCNPGPTDTWVIFLYNVLLQAYRQV